MLPGLRGHPQGAMTRHRYRLYGSTPELPGGARPVRLRQVRHHKDGYQKVREPAEHRG